MEHSFTPKIKEILSSAFKESAVDVFDKSSLLRYLNLKTKSASKGSKARSSFANLYAIYVLVEDYIKSGHIDSGGYSDYEGAQFAAIFKRQRELPFGQKLQNHALNSRMNDEYKKFFQQSEYIPIIRNLETRRYWINENLIKITTGGKTYCIARVIIQIIDAYVAAKKDMFQSFINTCEDLRSISSENHEDLKRFVVKRIAPNVDARVFEIVSYAILKYYYREKVVYFGFSLDDIEEQNLILYKTGRTNANDGGIDFVMRPLGRFFQVTETLDAKKYFLDIDKIEKFPLTFVIKSDETVEAIKAKLQEAAQRTYSVKSIVNKYMKCIEEVINIPILKERFEEVLKSGNASMVLDEIIIQSKVEFNLEEPENEE